jgi:hypothetical protein
MIKILLAAILLHGPATAPGDTASEVYRAVLRDLGAQHQPAKLVVTTAVRLCNGAVCNRVAPDGYPRGFLQSAREEGLIGDDCTYFSGECVRRAAREPVTLDDVQVTLSAPAPCGSACYEVTSWAIVLRNQSIRDVRTLYRIEEVSGHWAVTRRTDQGAGFIN